MSLLALVLQSTDLAVLRAELEARREQAPQLFDNDPLVIDLSQVAEADGPIQFPAPARPPPCRPSRGAPGSAWC